MKRVSMPAGRPCGGASMHAVRSAALSACAALMLCAAAPAPIVQTKAEPILVESVAFDARGRMIVSAVRAGGVFRIGRNGALTPWSRDHGRAGFFGIAADPARNALWAVTSCSAYADCPDTVRPSLVRMNLRTGKVERTIAGGEGAKAFGDIVVGADGAVYVSDSGSGDVLRLAPGAAELTRVAKVDQHPSPQGLAISDDGAVLVFSNYANGLHRVDLRTGALTRIAGPEGIDIRGVDGVARRGNTLIMVRNAVTPARVIAVTLNADWTQVVSATVLAEGEPMAEPTGGVIRGDDFVFVSRSQWTDFDREGRPKADLGPAIVSRLRISPPPQGTPSGG